MKYNEDMSDLRHLLFEKELVGKVLERIRKEGLPDPATDPERALIHGHALCLNGDLRQALKVFSAIPRDPASEAERLWGMANAHLRLGGVEESKRLLDEALAQAPSDWLLLRIYNTQASIYVQEGQFEQAHEIFTKGLEAVPREPHSIARWILAGNQGVLKGHQGFYEEAIFLLQKTVKQLLARGCVLSASHFLINLAHALNFLGDVAEAERCLSRAEGLIRESGNNYGLIYLRVTQGNVWRGAGLLDQAERSYEEALDLLSEYPIPKYDINLLYSLAQLRFKKGNLAEALGIIRKAQESVREKGLTLYESFCLFNEGSLLLQAGSVLEGMGVLDQARELAEARGQWDLYSHAALYLSWGYEELKQRGRALEWIENCFRETERCRILPGLLNERDILTPLLLKLGTDLPPTEFLSRLIVQLRHPALLKRLLRQSPDGKVLFLRSLSVHDARQVRPQMEKLSKDPSKEVRRASRLVLNGWRHHTTYRVYTFGTFRTFLEGRMLTDRDWIRPGVKRLFLYLATHPEEWQPTDALLEALWSKPHPKRTKKVLEKLFSYLRTVLEPWSRMGGPGRDETFLRSRRGAYGFFPGNRFWMDWKDFAEGIKRAEASQRSRSFKEARKAYREALDLYLGDYLEEFPYEDWLNPKRDSLRELYFRGVLRYATLEKDSGNLPEARRVLEEALFKDLSRSGCAALLIQVLTQMSFIQEGKEWGQRHVRYMKEELKERPAPEVLEALKRLG